MLAGDENAAVHHLFRRHQLGVSEYRAAEDVRGLECLHPICRRPCSEDRGQHLVEFGAGFDSLAVFVEAGVDGEVGYAEHVAEGRPSLCGVSGDHHVAVRCGVGLVGGGVRRGAAQALRRSSVGEEHGQRHDLQGEQGVEQ